MTLAMSIAVLLAASMLTDAQIVDLFALTESRMDHAAVGDRGRARSAWQIHHAAWEDVSEWRKVQGLPVYQYRIGTRDPEKSRAYAGDYLEIVAMQLRDRMKRRPTLEELWCGWNLGVVGFERRKFRVSKTPQTTRDGVVRMQNIKQEKGW